MHLEGVRLTPSICELLPLPHSLGHFLRVSTSLLTCWLLLVASLLVARLTEPPTFAIPA